MIASCTREIGRAVSALSKATFGCGAPSATPRRTGERSDDAELHARELPSVGCPFEGKSPHGAVLWLLNVATGWPPGNRLTACVRIQSVGGPFES